VSELPGILVVLSGPSGVGKTTVAHRLKERGEYMRSVSVTTRERRPGEVEGKDYHFVSNEEFDRLLKNGELIEHAEVHRAHYGTPKKPLREAVRNNKVLLLTIDVRGGHQILEHGLDALLIFLTARDDVLAQRLTGRGTEDEVQQTVRLERAAAEREHARRRYHHIVINDDLDRCVGEVDELVRKARQKLQERQAAGEELYPGLGMDER
jgi:guanylate kinase